MHLQGTKAQHRLTQEALRERAAQVNAVALDRLLQHTRRGCLQILWETALAEADARLACCTDVPAGNSLLQPFFWLCYEGFDMLGKPSALRPEARHHWCHQQREHHEFHIVTCVPGMTRCQGRRCKAQRGARCGHSGADGGVHQGQQGG